MGIDDFLGLVTSGFDVSFNHGDVFYTISLIKDDEENGRVYGIGGDNGFTADFASPDSIPDFQLEGTPIKDIVEALPEDEVFYRSDLAGTSKDKISKIARRTSFPSLLSFAFRKHESKEPVVLAPPKSPRVIRRPPNAHSSSRRLSATRLWP